MKQDVGEMSRKITRILLERITESPLNNYNISYIM